MNEQAIELLDHYLSPETASHGAVMVAGPWGAGKTHFIKDYLDSRHEQMVAKDRNDTLNHLYVSLYGVKSVSEIQAQFFAQTNPALNSGPVRLLGTVASRVLNTVTKGQAVKPEDAAAVQKFLSRSLKGLPLVFDDLERCAMPLPEIMGFINTFVEQEEAKVVVLCCEKEIPKDQRKAYRKRKEKLIGKTVEVQSDTETVYDLFLTEMRHPQAVQAARSGKIDALRTFEASGLSNLRSLRSALHDFDRLVSAVDARLGHAPEALRRILMFMIAVSLELRAGHISQTDIGALTLAKVHALFRKVAGAEVDRSKPDFPAIAARYPAVEWTDPIIPSDVLGRLLVRGVLDTAAANSAIGDHELIVGKAATPSWRRIWRWFELDQTEYAVVRGLFLEDLAQHNIVAPGPLLHAIGTIITLREQGDDLLAGQDPVEFLRAYLAALESRDALEPDLDSRHRMDRSIWGNLTFSSQDTDGFKAARVLLDAAVDRATNSRLAAKAPALLERLRSTADYSELGEFGPGSGAYSGSAILHNLDVAAFADLCIQDGLLNDDLLGELSRRYHLRGPKLREEAPWIHALRSELVLRANGLPAPFASRVAHMIAYWFDRIDENLGVQRVADPAEADPSA